MPHRRPRPGNINSRGVRWTAYGEAPEAGYAGDFPIMLKLAVIAASAARWKRRLHSRGAGGVSPDCHSPRKNRPHRGWAAREGESTGARRGKANHQLVFRFAEARCPFKGKKRHILVDMQGLPLQALVTSADVQDLPQRQTLALAVHGDALDRRRHDGSQERIPAIESAQATPRSARGAR